MHMVTKCEYCGGTEVTLNKNSEWVCIQCATVLGSLMVWPRRRVSKREKMLSILYGYA